MKHLILAYSLLTSFGKANSETLKLCKIYYISFANMYLT